MILLCFLNNMHKLQVFEGKGFSVSLFGVDVLIKRGLFF